VGDSVIAQSYESVLSAVSGTYGLIAIDGVPGAGKSTLRRDLARDLQFSDIELDDFLVRDQNSFVDALRLSDLAHAVFEVPKPILLSGACILQVLSQLGLRADCLVYVKRMAIWGWADEGEIEGTELDDIGALLGLKPDDMALHLEVRAYHQKYKPHVIADIMYERRDPD